VFKYILIKQFSTIYNFVVHDRALVLWSEL